MRHSQLLSRCILVLFMGVIPSAILHAQTVTSVVVPSYMEGTAGTNIDRIPFACRLRVSGLLASRTYRFLNQMVISTDAVTSNGSGNCIFAPPSGDFVRTTSASLATLGNYGTFFTDATGAYEGWFIVEPTGNARFTAGKFVFMRIGLNDGGTGTTVATRVTTSDSVRVVVLTPAATDSAGTGLRGTTFSAAKEFVFTYDNTTGVGRPISGSFIESDGTANTTSNSYSAFYANSVDALRGTFGMVLPNLLPTGVRRVERRSLASGAVVAAATDADGLWPSGAQTVNPAGGTTAIVLSAADVNYLTTGLAIDPSSESYGDVNVSVTKTDTLIAKNTSGASLTISTIASSDTSAFAVTSSSGPITLPAGGTTLVRIAFHPRVPGQREGRITFTNTGNTSPDTIHVDGNGLAIATSVVFPRYMEGDNGVNSDRVPFACRLRLSKLLASKTYKYFNQVVNSSDQPTDDGAGNPIFAMQSGDFVRTNKVDFDSTNHYSTFTTDATGTYEGWFITEPTGGSRFVPAKFVFVRIALNDGGTGTTVATHVTTTDSVRVVKLSPGATDSTGTGLRGYSFAKERDFVFAYDNTAGTGRPLSGSYVERDGSGNTVANLYSPFYDIYVNGFRGAYGMVLPNLLSTGMRRIERRSLATGAVVASAADADGLWPSGAQTVNPNAGTTAIALTGVDVNYLTVGLAIDPAEKSFGDVKVSVIKPDSVIVKNTTASSFTINSIVSSDTSAFAVTSSAGPLTLAAGATTKVKFEFHPRVPGEREGRLTFTHTGPGSPDTLHLDGNGLPIATPVVFPRFMEGVFGTNTNRVPFACRLRLTKLLANRTYRYFNQAVDSSDPYASNGAGNAIFAPPSGNFVRTVSAGFDSTNDYGTFTTDATGAFEGWFITEPTGGNRFLPGKFVFMRIMLNDGGSGTTVFTRATTTDSVRIVKLSSGATDSTATGLRGTSLAATRDFIFTYDNTAGTGRPISGSFVESDGTANSALNSYSAFYATNVDAVPGAYGMVLPNLLATGVRRVERRSLATGALVASATDADGLWPSGAQTVNPSGGPTAIVLSLADVGYLSTGLVMTPSSLSFGNVPVSASKTDSVLARNTAGQPVTISSIVSSDTSAFALTSSAGPLTLPAGDSTRVRIVFHPRIAGPRGGRLTFTNTGPTSPDTLHLSGTGVVPSFTISPSGLSFGAVSLTLSQLDSVLVRNVGGATLSIASIVSNNASQFDISNAGPVSVLPGDSLRIRVTFHPTSIGQKDGRITFTHNGATSPDTIHVQGVGVRLTATVPRYLEGVSGTNANRIPFAYHARLEGLLASRAYRYINQVVTSADSASSNGAGNCIFAPPSGAFVRSTIPELVTTGNYGTLTTDSSGVYEGWFVTEPTGNSRFTPAGFVFMRICINDGGAGTTVFGRFTTVDSVRVVKLGPASDDSTGTGLRGTTFASSKDFIFTYDNTAGTGRPISGSFVESDGTANSALNSYSAFYATSVDGVPGAFGMVLPNLLATGVRRVDRLSLATGALVASTTDADGLWPSGAQTVNPSGGSTAIVLSLADVGNLSTGLVMIPSSLSFGDVPVSASKTDSVLARNTAGQPVTISSIVSSDTSAFALISSAGPLTLPAGDSTRVRIVFHPRTAGPREGRLTFTNNGPTSPDTLHLSGTGVAPAIAISPSPLSFGAVSLTLSQLDTVRVGNPGGATLSITSVVSNNASQFEVIDAGPVSVSPGDSVGIRVKFHPTSIGQKDGRITFTHNAATSPDTIHVTGVGVRLTALVPRYLEGVSGTNANRIPFAYHARLEGLLASRAYRYINQVVTSKDSASSNGAGNCIFAPPSGAFVRSTTPGLGTTGNYGTLTTDSLGVYEGWFVTEPNGNARFAPAGFVFMRICINDGGAGTTVFGRITTTDSVRVVKLGPASDDSSGTGLRGASGGSARQFVLVYDDSAGTGRPVSGSFIESDGTVNSVGNGYASFYADYVDTVGGAFGVVVPNKLPNGIRLVEQRSLGSGAVIASATDVDGTWPSGASTVNPAGGTTAIVLTQGDLIHTTDVEPGSSVARRFMLSQNRPNPFRPTTTIRFSVAEGGVATVVVYDILGRVVVTPFSGLATPGQEYTVTVDGKRLHSGVYWYRLKSGNRTATKKMLLLR